MTTTPTPEQLRLLVLCAIRVEQQSVDWSLIARQALFEGGVDRLYEGKIIEKSEVASTSAKLLRRGLEDLAEAKDRVRTELDLAASAGARLTTVLDADYPSNLRLIPNLPPFLFVRGELRSSDALSVAVVGTRKPKEAGERRARRMSEALAREGVTVTSGLALGIDAAAHETALDAGGRTLAVLGTGITKCYPEANSDLAERIAAGGGALVSQFWPSTGPARWTFPRRNVVTSGISQGTVVIEAGPTSGAKMQARLALEHRKRVFLIRSLVTDQPWARKYLARGAIEVADVADVIKHLAAPERIEQAGEQRRQQQLELL